MGWHTVVSRNRQNAHGHRRAHSCSPWLPEDLSYCWGGCRAEFARLLSAGITLCKTACPDSEILRHCFKHDVPLRSLVSLRLLSNAPVAKACATTIESWATACESRQPTSLPFAPLISARVGRHQQPAISIQVPVRTHAGPHQVLTV